MRRNTVVGAVLLSLCVLIAGCASDRGFRCAGDLVRINAPAKAAKTADPKHTRRSPSAVGDRP